VCYGLINEYVVYKAAVRSKSILIKSSSAKMKLDC